MDFLLQNYISPFHSYPILLFCGSIALTTVGLKSWSSIMTKIMSTQLTNSKQAQIIYGKLFGDIGSYVAWKSTDEGRLITSRRTYQFQLSYTLNTPAILCWVTSDGVLFHFHFIKSYSDSETALPFNNLSSEYSILCLRFTPSQPCHLSDVHPEVGDSIISIYSLLVYT